MAWPQLRSRVWNGLSRPFRPTNAERGFLPKGVSAVGATLCAVLLWLAVSLNNEHVTRLSVPVTVINPSAERALKQPLPSQIRLIARGRGWALVRMKLRPPEWQIDLSGRREGYTITTSRAPGAYLDLPRDVTVQVEGPETIPIVFDEVLTRRLPIESRVTVELANGFILTSPLRILPDSVAVTGAATKVAALTSWPTVERTLTEQRSNLSLMVPLEPPQQSLFDLSTTTASLYAEVQELTEDWRTNLPVLVTGVPAGKQVVLRPPRMSVLLRGGVDHLARLTDDSVQIRLAYSTVMADTTGALRPQITGPAGAEIVRTDPVRVQYIVRSRAD